MFEHFVLSGLPQTQSIFVLEGRGARHKVIMPQEKCNKHREYCTLHSEYKLRLLCDFFHGVLNVLLRLQALRSTGSQGHWNISGKLRRILQQNHLP